MKSFKLLLTNGIGVLCLSVATLTSMADVKEIGECDLEEEVKRTVRSFYIHGMPYAEASKFDERAVPLLAHLLQDGEERAAWLNIIYVLGLIGDDAAVDALLAFEGRHRKGEIDTHEYVAISSVYGALGHAAARPNERALEHLISLAAPEAWTKVELNWTYRGINGELNKRLLWLTVIRSLGLTAQPEAMAALNQLLKTVTYEPAVALIHEAIDLANRLQAVDRRQYFLERDKQRFSR